MPIDPVTVSVAILAVVILGLSKGGFAGVGMVTTPLLSLVVPAPQAAGIILPVLIFQDLISMYAYRKTPHRWNLAVLIPGGIVGVLVGWALVSQIERSLFELILGGISLVFGIERIYRYFVREAVAVAPRGWVGVVSGVMAGFTSMIAHAGIPPFQFFVLPQRLPRDVYIGTSVFFYGAINLIKLPFFLSLGQVNRGTFSASVALFPVAFGSVLLGVLLIRRVTGERYILVANLILVGIGLLLVGRGLAG